MFEEEDDDDEEEYSSSELWGCVNLEVAVQGSPSLTVLNMVSVDVTQRLKKKKMMMMMTMTMMMNTTAQSWPSCSPRP